MNDAPEFLAVGHVTHDIFPGGILPGGSVCYAALTARALGCRTLLWTSYGPDFAHAGKLAGMELHVRPAERTTTFENRYVDGQRTQRVDGIAAALDRRGLPPELTRARIVHLCPVIDEVELALASCFPDALVGIGVQGWVRRRCEDGRVLPKRWDGLEPWLDHVDVAVLAEAEAAAQDDLLPLLCDRVPVVALTRGAQGSTVFVYGEPHEVPAVPAREVDPTGAGDVYGAALLVRLAAGDDPLAAARFASAAAARIVEGQGTSNVGAIAELKQEG